MLYLWKLCIEYVLTYPSSVFIVDISIGIILFGYIILYLLHINNKKSFYLIEAIKDLLKKGE